MKQDPDLIVTKRVKANWSRMPLGVKFAFILVVALLLPGVTSKSIPRSVETTVTSSPSVADGPKADNLEKEAALEKHELESNEIVTDLSEVGLIPFDDSLNYEATANTVPAEENTNTVPENAKMKETSGAATNFEEYPNTGTEVNMAEGEDLTDLDDGGVAEDEIAKAVEVMRLLVKRASEGGDKAGELQADSMDVDNFQFSDFPKLIEPLVEAFSDTSEKEASELPSQDDFFLWFPAVKKFLEFAMESSAAKPTGVPTSSATKPARRSGFPTSSEPTRQIAPSATEPAESEVLPPTLQDVFVTPELPTIAGPLSPVQPSLSVASDSEERVY